MLRTWKLGEADRIVSLHTRDNGKVRAVAKGVRRTRSKFGARLEAASHVAVQLYRGRSELQTLTGAETIERFVSLREDPDRFARASAMLEAVDQLATEAEGDPDRHNMLVGALRTLDSLGSSLVVAGFFLKLLALEGVQLEVQRCVACGGDAELVAIDVYAGGVLCRQCRSGRPLSAEALATLRQILGGRLAAVLRESPGDAAEGGVTSRYHRYRGAHRASPAIGHRRRGIALRPVTSEPADPGLFDTVVNLCVRRGFVFRSAEIYGGFRSAYDYGPLGVLLLRNVKEQWWRSIVQSRHDVVGLDASILAPPAVWEASGHLANFTDPLVDCRACGTRHRQDKLADPEVCPDCGRRGELTQARQFNLMFSTNAGPVADSAAQVYLRPETAQGTFINFANVARAARKTPPFGIAQIGKSFRNEITPGNFVFRTREFEQMELEYFVPAADAGRWFEYWCEARHRWYLDLGIDAGSLRLRPHGPAELSHYSSATTDVEYLFPWGWDELEGIADRGDYDLRCHAEGSGERLDYFDAASGEHRMPHVIEPAAGATRAAMAFLLDAYSTETVNDAERVVLRLDRRLAPVSGCGAAAVSQRSAGACGAAGLRPARRGLELRLRRDSGDRAPLPAPGRDRHAAVRHRRLRHPRR